MDRLLSVKELAEEGGTTPRAVRIYMDMGLLKPMKSGRICCFREGAVERLAAIRRAKRLGFSLGEIKSRLGRPRASILKKTIRRVEAVKRDADLELAQLRRQLADSEELNP
jgi:DNA-binding transcriptional MerR regulator